MKLNDLGWLALVGAGSYLAYRTFVASPATTSIDLTTRQPRPLPSSDIPAERAYVVRTLQTQLRALGFTITEITGTANAETGAAIMLFARQHHLAFASDRTIDAERRVILAVDDAYGALAT